MQTPRRLSTPLRRTYSPLAADRSETLKTQFQQSSPPQAQSAGDAPNTSSPSAKQHRDAAEASRTHSDLHTPTRARTSKRHTPLKSILSSGLRPILPRELDYSVRKRTANLTSGTQKTVRFRDDRLVEALSPYTQYSWSSPDSTPYHARISLVGGGSGDADDLEEQLARLELLGSDITSKEHEEEQKEQEASTTDQAVDEHRAYLQKKKDEDTGALQEARKQRKAQEDEWSDRLEKRRAAERVERRAKRLAAAEKEKAQQREAAEAQAKAQAQDTVETPKRADDVPDEAVQILIEQLDLIQKEEKTAGEKEFVADLPKPPVTPAKIINAISQEWEKKVAAAMGRSPSTTKVVGDRSDITAKALATLSNRTWLNDEIINEYVRHVVERALKQAGHTAKTQPPPFCALNSNWWNTIHSPGQTVQDGLKKVMRWAKRAKVGGANLLNVDKLFIPINASMHWMLLVIHGKERKMEFLNSMEGCGPSADRVFGVVYQYLALELGSAFDKHEWTCVAGRSPQQDNGYDCGVFVCYNAVSLALKREPIEAFMAKDMILGRRQIAATLLNEGLTGEFELF